MPFLLRVSPDPAGAGPRRSPSIFAVIPTVELNELSIFLNLGLHIVLPPILERTRLKFGSNSNFFFLALKFIKCCSSFEHMKKGWIERIQQKRNLDDPWFYRRRQWQPTPVLLPGKSHERRSLVGCSPWGR